MNLNLQEFASIDLVTRYDKKVDEMFYRESSISLLTNQDYDWTGANSVKVYRVTTAPMTDYDRAGENEGSHYGQVHRLDAITDDYPLTQDRAFTFEADRLDIDETGECLAAAKSLARQLREQVFPEMDRYVYDVMCTKAGIKPTAKTLTATNIYDEIIEASRQLDNAEAPENFRNLVVTPDVYVLIKKNPDIMMNTDIGEELRRQGVVGVIDGMNVIKVGANRLPEEFGFMACHPIGAVVPNKLKEYRIHQNPPGISGDLVEGRFCYDCFVLTNKANAIYYQAIEIDE